MDYPSESLGGSTNRTEWVKALNNPKLKLSMKEELEEKLKPLNIPDGCELLWEVFWDLFTGEKLPYSEILAYSKLCDIHFTTQNITMLRLMDNAACKVLADDYKSKNKR